MISLGHPQSLILSLARYWTEAREVLLMWDMNIKNLNELAEQLRTLLPTSAGRAQEEIRASLKVFLEATLAKMQLVTREEFDAQTALLARTREKLEQLEAAVAELEKSPRA